MASAPSEPRAGARPRRQGRATDRGRSRARGAAARGGRSGRPDARASPGRGGRAARAQARHRGFAARPSRLRPITTSSLWVHATPGRRRDRLVARRLDGAARSGPAPRFVDRRRNARRDAAGRSNEWAADEELRVISLSSELAELLGVDVAEAAGAPLTRILRLEEDESGDMPLISALALRRGLPASARRSRIGRKPHDHPKRRGGHRRRRQFRRVSAEPREARRTHGATANGALARHSITRWTKSFARRSTGSSRAPSTSSLAPMGRCAANMRATATTSPRRRGICCRSFRR